MLGVGISFLRIQNEIPHACKAWIFFLLLITACRNVEYAGECSFQRLRTNRQRGLGTDLSLLRFQDRIPQNRTLVSFSIGKRLNRRNVLGVDISFLRIQDDIPHACKAWFLVLLITTCHNVEYVDGCSF